MGDMGDTDSLDLDLDLDHTWVESYKMAEQDYDAFYNEPVTAIKVFSLYVNTANTVVTIKRDQLPLATANRLPREQLIALIKAKQYENAITYKLFSVLRYNINLLPTEIADFIAPAPATTQTLPLDLYTTRFLTQEAYVTDIYFSDTISIFQDLNALYLIFKEPERKHTTNAKNKNTDAHKFTQKLKASIKKRYTRHR